jgi:hypothetical protein
MSVNPWRYVSGFLLVHGASLRRTGRCAGRAGRRRARWSKGITRLPGPVPPGPPSVHGGSCDCQLWRGLLLSGHAPRLPALPSLAGPRQRGRHARPRHLPASARRRDAEAGAGWRPRPSSRNRLREVSPGAARRRGRPSASPAPARSRASAGLHAGRLRARGDPLFELNRRSHRPRRTRLLSGKSPGSAGVLASLRRSAIVSRRSGRSWGRSVAGGVHGRSAGSGRPGSFPPREWKGAWQG